MDIPSLFMIPSAVSSGKVHSVFPNSTDADFDFNRDSDATRVNSEGLIERVGFYGAEKLSNNDFTNGLVGYSGTTNYSVVNNQLVANSSGLIYQGSILTNSTFYKFTIDIESVTSGGIKAYANGNQSAVITTAGIHTLIIQAGTSNTLAGLNPQGTFIGVINSISFKEVLGDRARLNYEIEGGLVNTKPSLLLEPQSTNLVTYSEDFSQSYWAKNKLTVTPNAVISPTGELNASLIQETSYTSSTNSIDLENAISLSAGTYTLSFYVKNNKGRYLGISFGSSSERVRTNFDFNTNTFKTLNLSGTTTGSASFTTLGDFYRISVTATFPSTVPVKSTITPLATDTYPFFALQDSDNRSFYLWGVQWEELSYPTSYIPTNGSTQTRAAETCNGAGTSSILPNEGILYFDFKDIGLTHPNQSSISISGSNSNNRILIYRGSGGAVWQLQIKAGGSTILNTDLGLSGADSIANYNKVAVRYKSGSNRRYVNGTRISANGSVETTTFTLSDDIQKIQFLPDASASSNQGYGKFRDIRVYNTKEMTDSEVDILLTKITS